MEGEGAVDHSSSHTSSLLLEEVEEGEEPDQGGAIILSWASGGVGSLVSFSVSVSVSFSASVSGLGFGFSGSSLLAGVGDGDIPFTAAASDVDDTFWLIGVPALMLIIAISMSSSSSPLSES